MKDNKNDSTTVLSRFGRDKRQRTVTATAERVERRPRLQRDAADSEQPSSEGPRERASYNPHFRTVSEHSPLPVILYNIPGRSGVNMTAETTLRLAREMKNVIGIKEASGDIEQMQHESQYQRCRYPYYLHA